VPAVILSLSVETFRGPVGRAPSLRLAVWLSWDGPARPWKLTVVEDALAARERPVEKEVVDALEAALRAAGLGSRPVRVTEVVDTSDTAGFVRIRAEGEALTISMMSSGFKGEDAGPLRDFLRRLLAAADVDSEEIRWATLGED
jgi:hypothetical protein